MSKPKLLSAENRVCIICEGLEEYDYLKKIKELNLWNKKYSVDLRNARGIGRIFAIYQDIFQNGSYDAILIFCDTDKKPFKHYLEMKEKIDEFYDVAKGKISNQITIFGNPCTMQIIIMHWANINLRSNSKTVNAPIIAQYTGIKGYKARDKQREAMMSQINRRNYSDMISRVSNLSHDYRQLNSSNFDEFMKYLQGKNTDWIEKINTAISEE